MQFFAVSGILIVSSIRINEIKTKYYLSRLHRKLERRFDGYRRWHKNPTHAGAHWVILLFFALGSVFAISAALTGFLADVEIDIFRSFAAGNTYYLAPTGSDSNPGTSAAPFRTFSFAIPRLTPGDTLILKNGTYTGSNSGYPNINCTSNAANGTAGQPITIQSQNERKAFIQGDGMSTPFSILSCQWWVVAGLHIENTDNPANTLSNAAVLDVGLSSHNIVVRRNLLAKPNRHGNNGVTGVGFSGEDDSSNITFEENEVYDHHRNGISCYEKNMSRCVLRRNYINARNYPCLPGTEAWCSSGVNAGIITYGAKDSIIENNIVEGTSGLDSAGQNNRFYGNVTRETTISGFHSVHHGSPGWGECCRSVDNLYVNNVAADMPYNGIVGISAPGFIVENFTAVNNGATTQPPECPPGLTPKPGGGCALTSPAKPYLSDIDSFPNLLKRLIEIFLYFAGGLAVLMLMIGGFRYVTARGNEEQLTKAKVTIQGAIIAIIIIVLAFSLVAMVSNLLQR